MQNIAIHFIFYFFIVRTYRHSTRDIIFVIFFGMVFVTFIYILSVAFTISLHTITRASIEGGSLKSKIILKLFKNYLQIILKSKKRNRRYD